MAEQQQISLNVGGFYDVTVGEMHCGPLTLRLVELGLEPYEPSHANLVFGPNDRADTSGKVPVAFPYTSGGEPLTVFALEVEGHSAKAQLGGVVLLDFQVAYDGDLELRLRAWPALLVAAHPAKEGVAVTTYDTRTTWRKAFEAERAVTSDDSPVVAVAPDEAVLDVVFDRGYGNAEGSEVLIWTERRVYFPVVYDGAEWLQSAPRNPQAKGQGHVGGQ